MKKKDNTRRIERKNEFVVFRRRIEMNNDREKNIIMRCYITLFDCFFNFNTKSTFVKHLDDHVTRSIRQFANSTDLND